MPWGVSGAWDDRDPVRGEEIVPLDWLLEIDHAQGYLVRGNERLGTGIGCSHMWPLISSGLYLMTGGSRKGQHHRGRLETRT